MRVQFIEEYAFYNCEHLSSLRFGKGSKLIHVGAKAFRGTQLTPASVKYPNALRYGTHGGEW